MNKYIIFLSGGVGNRFGSKIPKQYTKNSKGVYYFQQSMMCFKPFANQFKKIMFVCNDKYELLIKRELSFIEIPITFVPFGSTRQESINNAINILRKEKDISKTQNQVFIQEAVRPFVTVKMIANLLNVDSKYKAVAPVKHPSLQHAIYDPKNGIANKLLLKNYIVDLQLPRRYDLTFWLEKTLNAPYNIHTSDETQLFLDNDIMIKCIEGEQQNIKITYRHDEFIYNLCQKEKSWND